MILLLAVGSAAAYRCGWLRLNYPSRNQFPVQGIDVSHHQGQIEWAEVAGAGVSFAFIKSTEGATLQDRQFSVNAGGASSSGLHWAPYHFYTFCAPGAAQAANFVQTASKFSRTLPPVVDIEFVGNCKSWTSLDDVRRELSDFLERVESGLSERPILYVTREAEERVLAGAFPNHPRWARSVFGEPSRDVWPRWTFWQYADNVRLPGIEGPVDMNVYCCSPNELDAISGL